MATAFERWEQTLAELAKNKAKPEDVEKARIALRQKVIEKARQEDPDNSGMALALSRFDNGTRAQSYRSGLVKEPDVLTEDERSGVDHPVLGGIKQAAKELVATQAQGWQRIAGSALRLANDFGENEKGTWLDRAATSMEDAQKSTDEFAGEGYATADGIRGFGKMGLQNAPILISTYLTGGAAAGATSLAGRAAGLAKTAQGAAKVANAARWAGAGGAAAAGFSGEYGDARQQTLDKFKSITPEQMRESEKYAARFKALEKELYLAGATPDDAAKQAYEETVDALSETDANIVGVVNSLIEFAAPGASKFFLGGGKLSSKSIANAKKFVNLDDVKDVSKQFGQEFLQEGFTSAVTDDTRAKAMNEDVNWGQVGKDALVGGTLGAIMGGGAQFSTGQSTRQRALAEVKAQEQQQGLDAQLGQAAQARKAELDAIRQQRPLTPEEQEDADVADAILARNAPQQPPAQGGQPAGTPAPQPAPAPQAGAPIVGATPQPAGAPVGSNIPQPPELPQPAHGLSGVIQRHTQSAAPALDTVFGDAIKGNQVPDFTGLAQQTGLDRNALVDQFNAKRTEHVRKQGLMDLAEQGDLNALRSAVSGITVDPQQQDQLIEEAVAGNEQRKAEALAASQQQDAQAQQQAQQSAQQQADKDKYDQTYSKMLDEAVAALEGGQTEVKTFLPIKKKYSASGLNATDVNGVIEHAKQVIAEKQQKAARHEQAVTEAMPHLQSGDEASAVLAMEQAGVTDDADVQSVLKEANKRIRQDSKKPAGTQSVPVVQPADPLASAVAEVKAAQASGKKVNLATIAKKHGVPILDVAKGATAKPEQAAPKAKPSQPLALPAPQGPATTGEVMVSRNGKVMSQAEADALDAVANADKKQMRRDMAEEAGNPTGIPSGMRPRVETPARTEQKAVLPNLILRTDGKPFPDAKQATRVLASKKLEDTHEVVSVDGGKAIAPKKSVTAKNQVDPEKDDILSAIAKLGGIDREQAKSQGVDPADFSRRAGGIQFVFRKNGGKELDRMAEALSEMGYPVTENGDYTVNALLDSLDAALRGSAVGTPIFHEARARAEYEAQYEEEMAQAAINDTWDSPGSSSEPDWMMSGTDDAMSSILDDDITPAPVIASELEGIENERRDNGQTEGSGQEVDTRAADSGAATGAESVAGRRSGGQQEGQGGAGQDSGVQDGFSLTGQTEAERLAEEQRQSAGLEAKRQADEAVRLKAQADKDREGFTLTGSNRPADVAMAAGQNDLFAPQTRGEKAAKAEPSTTTEPVKWFGSRDKADAWIAKNGPDYHVVQAGPSRFEVFAGKKPATPNQINKQGNPARKRLGVNYRGETLYEDEMGVRSYATGGVLVSESVSIIPGKGIERGELTKEYKTADELSAEKGQESGKAAPTEDLDAMFDDVLEEVTGKPKVTNTPKASVESAFTGEPDPKNSAPMQELGGFAVGDKVAISGRSVSDGVIRQLFTRQSAGGEMSMARVDVAGGKSLDLLTDNLSRQERTAGQAAVSAAKNTGMALGDAIDGLGKLFGGNKFSTGLTFDEKTYAKAKPYFIAAISHLRAAGGDLREAMRAVVKMVVDKFGADAAGNMKPYVVQFIADVRDGKIDDPAATLSNSDTKEATGNDVRKLDTTGAGTLEGVSSGEVQRPETEQPAGAGADGGSRGNSEGNGRVPGAGVQRDGGVGTDAQSVPVSGTGERGRVGGRGRRGGRGTGGTVSEGVSANNERGAVSGGRRVADSSDASQPQVALEPGRIGPPQLPDDFIIEDDLALGEGGQRTKYKQNVEAIKLVKALDAEGRTATTEEQKIIAKYVGWGGIPQAFDPSNSDWSAQYSELNSILTKEEYESARESTQYAHYTSREIIGAMYSALRQFGFTGGNVLEAGGGVGNFIGLMPVEMRTNGKVTLIERERIASAIARHLYPRQNVRTADFTEFGKGQDGQYDAQIGNPPFASTPLTDKSDRRHLTGLSIHNYFIAKGIDMLRPGGITAVVVTNSFMDATGDRARKYIGERAKLLGAIRLPNNAFSKNANTQVTTDIIFLQKLPEAEWGSKSARDSAKQWIDTANVSDPKGGNDIPLNRYFVSNPQMMLGQWGRFGTMRGPDQPALVARQGQNTDDLLQRAVASLPKDVFKSLSEERKKAMESALLEKLHDDTVSEGGFYADGGKLWRRVNDVAGEEMAEAITASTIISGTKPIGDNGVSRLMQLAELRKTMRGLLAAEIADNVKSMDALRADLNRQYDAYVRDNGKLNDTTTKRLMRDDPDYPLLAALEMDYEPGMGPAAAKREGIKSYSSKAKKAAIFDRRVIEARKPVTAADSPQDAINISMAERGRLDADYVGRLLGIPSEEVLDQLSSGASPLLFRDPASGEYVLRDAYLSGNVREKLKQAQAAGMSSNVRALEEVLPEDVPASQISVRLGSPWVPMDVYRDFAKHLFGDGTKTLVSYISANGSFNGVIKPESDVIAMTKFGTKSYPGDALMLALMNNRQIKVTYRDSDGKTHTDQKATEEANAKADEIKQAFQDWAFKDADRAELMARSYNDANNNYVVRKYDGSWLSFPGKVPDAIITFRRHQRNAIARTVQDRTSLYDHVVGAGKTFTAIASAMELKRTGLANKPMMVVPNHLVGQWAADFYRLYPGAKVLAATKKDFERTNRRKFMAKIASGDWDAIIIAHSSFSYIKPNPEFELQFNQGQIDGIVRDIEAVKAEDGEEQQKKRTVKQLEKLKESLENKIARLRDKPMDDLLDFQQLGVDQLFVDEAHCFPADAKVITDAGVLTIGEIVENRLQLKVLSVDSLTDALEWKQVTDWFKNSVTHFPVRIHHEGGAFECTANHKIWTYEEGFVEAGSLTGQHTICLAPVWAGLEAGGEALRDVRNGVQLQVVGEGEQRQEAVLLEPMRGELAHDAAAHQGRDHPWVTGWAEAGGGAPSREERPEIVGAHDGEQPDAQPGVEGKNGVIAFREDVLISRREQQDHDAAIDAARGDGASNGVLYRNGAGQEYVQVSAELLQSGFGSTGQEDCHRGGWQDAQAETMEAAGCKEDGSSKRARVVCVEVLERGSDGQFAEGFRGDQSVYCLEVEDNHNFFADGVLVSNSFKNLMFGTKMQNVRGLGDPAGSQRAYDMYLKTRQLMDQNGRGQGVVFMTGTPVSNSLAEMYHMMRYLMPQQMEQLGFDSFDAWANTFASVNQVWMQNASGDGFKAQNRMSSFDNIPELLKMFDQVADTVTMDDIKAAFREENNGKEFPLPPLATGRRIPVPLEKSDAQIEYMEEIAKRAKALEQRRGPPQKGDDNVLVLMTDARKAAMDIRLVNPDVMGREAGGRIDRASDEIVSRWKKYADQRGVQLVFSDLGTPKSAVKAELKEYEALMARVNAAANQDVIDDANLGAESALDILADAEDAQNTIEAKGADWLGSIQAAQRGFSVYDDLKSALVEKGIPENQIAFIHDFNTDDQKAALFRKVNNGDIRVMVGSTPKMGAGTNVQKRLVALHHLDVPWKPSDLEQREGRIIRQGNLLSDDEVDRKPNPLRIPGFEVEILAYVTKDTLDMRMWQIQETKLKMINQLRSRQIDRDMENAFEEMEMSAGEMQAAATGNMDLLREIQLRTEVQKLEKKQRAFDAGRADVISGLRRAKAQMESIPGQILRAKVLAEGAEKVRNLYLEHVNSFKATINGKDYTDRTVASQALRDMTEAVETGDDGKERKAKLDVTLNGEHYTNRQKLAEAFARLTGDREPFVFEADGEVMHRLEDASDAILDDIEAAKESNAPRVIGSMGPFTVSIEYEGVSAGDRDAFNVYAEIGDADVSAVVRGGEDDRATGRNIARAVRDMVRDAPNGLESEMKRLEKAKKTVADYEKIDTSEAWPDGDKLERLRAEHRAILERMNSSKPEEGQAADDGDQRFSVGEGSGPALTTTTAREILAADPVLSKAMPFIELKVGEIVPAGAAKFLPAYHGSPYKFDKFSLDHMGKGEGAQVYGWGLYFAGNKAVADWYRQNLSSLNVGTGEVSFRGKVYDFSEGSDSANDLVSDLAGYYGISRRAASGAVVAMREHLGVIPAYSYFTHAMENKTKDQKETHLLLTLLRNDQSAPPKGQLYQVDIPEDGTYLLWDKPLSEQPEYVSTILSNKKTAKAFAKYATRNKGLIDAIGSGELEGWQAYESLVIAMGSPEKASRFLGSIGISGIKYLDGASRSKGEGNHNYVVFDDTAVRILETYYSAGKSGGPEGYYHNGKITLFPENIKATPTQTAEERLKWVAFHEVTHRGVANLSESREYMAELQQAGKNPFIKNLAKKIHAKRQGTPYEVSMEVAIEEALAEANAALQTGSSKTIKAQYGLHFPLAIRGRAKSAIARFFEAVKRIYNKLTGRGLTNEQVGDLLRKTHEAGMGPDGGPKGGKKFSASSKTINIDGKDRPTTNSTGKPIATTEAGIRNFWKWFGDSKIVDEQGRPLVVYHGSRSTDALTEFVVSKSEASNTRLKHTKDGAYFTRNPGKAADYAGQDGSTYPVYLKISKPKMISDAFSSVKVDAAQLKTEGFDGMWNPKGFPSDEIVAIDKNQIKSATGNNGDFSADTSDIRYSAPPTPGQPPSRSVFASVAKQWMFQKWTETLGTQLNTAMLEPLFKPTYQLVQRYLQHTSNDAYDAISVAPNLLGRLEDINDYGREIKNIGKFRKINADREAAAVPLFEGTRFDKKVYSDAVLKRVYNLTDDQVAVYREARAAIEASLDSHAKSVITKILLDAGAVEFSDIDKLVNRDLPADDYMEDLRQRLDADILAANDAIAIQKTALSAAGVTAQDKASIQASIKKGSRRVELLEEAAKRIDSTEDTLSQLKREGYFPLMRWGKYTVTAKDAGGNVVDFRMVETLREKAALSEALTKQYQGQGMTVTSGTMDEGRFKDFRGMSPETLALFAKELGVDHDEAYQEYLKLALPGQSALKRRIHRKGDNGEGIAGFSMDIQRTLASFVMGNARHSARNIYGSAITKSVDSIPGERGDVRGLARNLAEFVTQPDENSTSVSIRNMLFVWNMGASVAFGALNLSQPWMMTLPWLSQFSGIGSVVEIMGKASKTAAIAQKNGTVPQEYYAEYQQAVREGHVDPQNVFMLQGIERGGSGLGSSLLKTVSHGMGMIAAATESYNRKLTLFAALDVARAKGLPWLKSKGFDSAYAFAVQAVAETQGVYNKGNRPTWARGQIGAVLLVFKQYAVNWIEMAVRMGRNHYGEDRMRKGLMMMLGLLFAMAGAMGMTGAEDLKDIVETAMGSAGKPVNIERQMQMTLGKGMADAVMAGPMNALVLNSIGLDMHGRMSMGNIIPGTGAFNPYTSTDAKLSEGISVMGAGTGLLKKGSDAVAAAQDGRFLDAAQSAAPRAVESIMKGVRMLAEGKARDSRGNVLMETTPAQAVSKMLDFQPASVAITQRERGRRFQDKNIQMVARTSLRNRLITAYEEKDAEKIRGAEQALDEWNQDNPLYQIKLKKRDLRRAAKKRGSSWMKREETPKGMEWMDEYAPEEGQ